MGKGLLLSSCTAQEGAPETKWEPWDSTSNVLSALPLCHFTFTQYLLYLHLGHASWEIEQESEMGLQISDLCSHILKLDSYPTEPLV